MKARLIRREIFPFLLSFGLLVVAALLVDAALHLANMAWIGRYLGIPGTLILGSFGGARIQLVLVTRPRASTSTCNTPMA